VWPPNIQFRRLFTTWWTSWDLLLTKPHTTSPQDNKYLYTYSFFVPCMVEHRVRVLRSGKKWSQAPARYFRLYGGLARSRPGYMYVLTYRYARSARAVSIELSRTTGYAEPTASRARAGDSAVYFLHRSVHCTSIFHRRARVRTFYFQLRNISSANRVGTRRDLVHPIIHGARRRPWSIVV
jgi:hypothetical protein